MRGIRVRQQKLDPYVNVDPGTTNPFQHGEVFVTETARRRILRSGCHYERFSGINLTPARQRHHRPDSPVRLLRMSAPASIWASAQVIPHVTNEIKERMRRPCRPGR